MKIILIALLFSVGTTFTIDFSTMPEKSVYVRVNDADDLIALPAEKCLFTAGNGVSGYNSKLRIKGAETVTKFKKGTNLSFYVRKWSRAGFSFSCVKMNVDEDKKVAESHEGISSDKNITVESIPFVAREVDKAKGIFTVVLNKAPEVGVWCMSFYNEQGGKFPMGGGYGNQAFCFEIVE